MTRVLVACDRFKGSLSSNEVAQAVSKGILDALPTAQVIDIRVGDGGDGTLEAVWGYNYHTLEGHFEQGQIEFTIHKQLNTGRVLMRIHAVSKTGHISNPFYRIGFRLFGRSLQRRFAHGSLHRTRQQVQDMLRKGKTSPPPSETPVQPVGTEQLPEGMAARVDEHVEQRQEHGEQ